VRISGVKIRSCAEFAKSFGLNRCMAEHKEHDLTVVVIDSKIYAVCEQKLGYLRHNKIKHAVFSSAPRINKEL